MSGYNNIFNIDEVQIEDIGDSFSYTIYAKGICTGEIKAVLSEYNSSDPSGRLEATSEWSGSYGTATVKKSILADKTDLYVYLLDDDTGVTSTVVKVYFEPCILKKWELMDDNNLVLFPDRGTSAYQFSQELLIAYKDSHSMFTIQRITLPNTKVGLEQLELWQDTQSFEFELQYYMVSEGAKIFSACSPKATVYIKPPVVTDISFSQNRITANGDFIPNLKIYADVILEDIVIGSYALSDNYDFTIASDIVIDEACSYFVRFYYKTDTGESLKTGLFPVVARVPRAVFCEYEGDSAIITLADSGVYEASYGTATKRIAGSSFSVPKETEKISLRTVAGNISKGEEMEYVLSCPAYYPLKVGNSTFYSLQDNPDKLKADTDIIIEVEGLPEATEAYSGTYFLLAVFDETATLTIKKEIYTAAPNTVRDDFHVMLKKYAGDNDTVKILRKTVKSRLPMEAAEFLFYHYGCNMADGYTGIVDGMSLFTEYTVYQNIPGASSSSDSDLSGFAGTGTARYEVIMRDQKIKIEPFASGMNFTVNPPAAIKSDNKLCGGAGVADLLYTGFSATYLRLVYPVKFSDRTSSGDLVYSNNICLLASDNMEALENATVNMRRGALSVTGVAYHYFRGRSVVIPQIKIFVNGISEWVSLGTTLKDIVSMHGAGSRNPVLKRPSEMGVHRVYCADTDMPLLIGDRIDIE